MIASINIVYQGGILKGDSANANLLFRKTLRPNGPAAIFQDHSRVVDNIRATIVVSVFEAVGEGLAE
jgi:hypothetical protein